MNRRVVGMCRSALVRAASTGQPERVALAFDGEPTSRLVTCASCSREYPLVTAFIADGGTARAVVFAACHSHEGQVEAWLDVAIGSFDEPDFADQATFSCRVRTTGATLFAGLVAAEGRAPFFGKVLTAEEAKAHPSLPDVWAVVDFVVTNEPTVEATVYGRT